MSARMTFIAAALLASLAVAVAGESAQPPYSWRGIEGSGVFPAKGLVTAFWDLAPDMVTSAKDGQGRERAVTLPDKPGTKKNIVWRTTLPYWGQNAPIVVKNRVFVMCDEGWKSDSPVLVGLNVADGTVLWQQPVDHLDAWPVEKAAEGRQWRAKDLECWRTYMRAWNALYWNNERNGWATKPEYRGRMIGAGQPENWVGQANADAIEDARRKGFTMPAEWRIGVSGGWRSRYYWAVGTDEIKNAYTTCNKNRYHWYTGWTSEGPYFGSTMGSVVGDGEHVYAVTSLDAAAGFDLDGHRLWVTDLDGRAIVNYPASAPGIVQNHIASPVLADGMLLYYHRDGATMYGLDAKTGKIAWKTGSPTTPDAGRDWSYMKGMKPTGYQGHMGPGGTPVVMRLGETTVAVSGHGMVVRISDGKLLGQVKIPKGTPIGKDKALAEAEQDTYGASYNSWVAHGDVLHFVTGYGTYAARLRVAGESLAQDLLWRLDGEVRTDGPNLVYHGDKLYAQVSQGKRRGIAAVDPATGKVVTWGPTSGGHDTALAFGTDSAVWPTGYIGDKTEGKSDPAKTPGHGMASYTVVALPSLKPLGSGYLCPEAPAGDVRDRHIAGIGTARVVWGNAGTTCWGNRIFIRSNDYLWCIGDPAIPFVPPEAVTK